MSCSVLLCRDFKLVLYLLIMYLQCVFRSMSQSPKTTVYKEQKQSSIQTFSIVSFITSAPILFLFFTVSLHEPGTRKASFGPRLNKTEFYLTPLLAFKIKQLPDKCTYSTSTKQWATKRLYKYMQKAIDTGKDYFQSW